MIADVRDLDRWFLLSLACLPACGDEANADRKCRDSLREAAECYGYSHPPSYFAMFCDAVRERAEPFGPDCVVAALESSSCISELQCEPDRTENVCVEARTRAHELCPERHGLCLAKAVEGLGPCGARGTDCRDGHEYAITCEPATDGWSCTCLLDGEEVGQYRHEGDCIGADFSFAFIEPAEDACGFPPSTP
jgi:hypothetical protein